MSIWPWRTRPVVTPFTDDCSAKTLLIGQDVTVFPFTYSIPDNLYMIPLSFTARWTCAVAIRGIEPTNIVFSRGGLIFAGAYASALLSNHALLQTFAPGLERVHFAGFYGMSHAAMPNPIYLYPGDLITYFIPSLVAGDIAHEIVLHAQTWEAH